jgi:predicted permease
VLPPGFAFAPEGQAEIWTPLQPTGPCERRRSCHFLIGVGRLKDGVSLDAALAETTTIARQLEAQYPDSNRDQGASVRSLTEATVGELRPILIVLLGGASLLLLIALANVASLLLVRAEGRRREMAVRGAIGASRRRLVHQFITEALVLVLLGGALGLACAQWGMQTLIALVPENLFARMPYLGGLGINAHVLIAAGTVDALALVVLSTVPLLRVSFADLRDGLNEGARGTAGRAWRRLGFRLVVVELAMAMVLLATAGLLGKSFYRLLNVELGFEPAPLATVRVAAPPAKYATDEARVALWRQVLGRTQALPGVESAALASVVPVSFNGNTDWIRFVGRPYNGEHNEVNQRDVSADYFKTLGATVRRGRGFTPVDRAGAPKVAVVNRTFVRLYFPHTEPLGARFGDASLSPDSIKTIVGVVEDIREGALDSDIWPAVYYPFEQDPDSSYFLVVRTAQAPGSVLPLLGATVWGIDPDVGTVGPIAMVDRISQSPVAHLRRSSMWLVGGFAGLALLLGAVGLFGVIAYSVGQRTREIGLRLAMGAPRASVYRLVLGEAARVTALGISIGLAATIAAAQLMRTLLFDTPPWDLPTLTGVAAVLALAALVASYVPARRAASVNPIEALRVD